MLDGSDFSPFAKVFLDIGASIVGIVIAIYTCLIVIIILGIYGTILLIIRIVKKIKENKQKI